MNAWRTHGMIAVPLLGVALSVFSLPARQAVGVPAPGSKRFPERAMGADTSAIQPTLRCARVPGAIRVDGVLDDEGWRGAALTGSFLNANARGVPAYPTVARVAWDYRLLYVAILSKDGDVTTTHRRRDDPIFQADSAGVLIGLDGFPDRYFEFAVNPAGALFDACVFDPGPPVEPEVDRAWNARRFQAAAKVDGTLERRGDRDRGWTAELAIPLVDMGLRRPPEPGDVWRINLYRIDRGPEPSFAFWSPTLGRTPNRYQPERFGYLEFSGDAS